MKITIEHYSNKFKWENEYGIHGKETPAGNLDESSLEQVVEVFAALLVAAGFNLQNIKDNMYEYGRSEFPEEI